jgi:hypothetical protein
MTVPNRALTEGGAPAEVVWIDSLSSIQTVTDSNLSWSVECFYDDSAWIDKGQGFFSATLLRLADNGTWEQVARSEVTLGNDRDNGHWRDLLTVSTTMSRETESYLLSLLCETRNTWPYYGQQSSKAFTAVQGSAFLGNFTLDFVPLSIVYCPPNQDMSASLHQAREYGTRITVGSSLGLQSSMNAGFDVDALGIIMAGVRTTESQAASSSAHSGIELSYFRNTVLTADNQRAIGRAYWGPLGDLFVIAVNPRFAVTRRADGNLFYDSSGIDQLIVAPAYKLLRPQDDPVVSAIPADARRRLLELDPFIHNLDLFFPDSGEPLSRAANPYADPTRGNRAELLGRWWLNTATELNYSVETTRVLKSGEANETEFQAGVTADEQVKWGVGGGGGFGDKTTVGLQSSRETVARVSSTAACFLIRNQNEKDLDAIQIYYDKLFSTFMFRKIPAAQPGLRGTITGVSGLRLQNLAVRLNGTDGLERETLTGTDGAFEFPGLPPGEYQLTAGNRSRTAEVRAMKWEVEETDLSQPDGGFPERDVDDVVENDRSVGTEWTDLDMQDVQRFVSLEHSPIWEVRSVLQAPSELISNLAQHSSQILDVSDVAAVLGVSRQDLAQRSQDAVVELAKTPLAALSTIPESHAAALASAGIDSIQMLWESTHSSEDVRSLSQSTGIAPSELEGIRRTLARGRASVTVERQRRQEYPSFLKRVVRLFRKVWTSVTQVLWRSETRGKRM